MKGIKNPVPEAGVPAEERVLTCHGWQEPSGIQRSDRITAVSIAIKKKSTGSGYGITMEFPDGSESAVQ